jgi:hypothetical protein
MSTQRSQIVTLEGCVEPAGPAAASARRSYQLTHIQPSGAAATMSSDGVAGTSQSSASMSAPNASMTGSASTGGTPPSAYQLAAGQGVDLSGRVGQRVQVIGTTAPMSTAATAGTSNMAGAAGVGTPGTTPSSSSTTTTPGSVSGSTAGQAPLGTFNVTSVQTLAASCQ